MTAVQLSSASVGGGEFGLLKPGIHNGTRPDPFIPHLKMKSSPPGKNDYINLLGTTTERSSFASYCIDIKPVSNLDKERYAETKITSSSTSYLHTFTCRYYFLSLIETHDYTPIFYSDTNGFRTRSLLSRMLLFTPLLWRLLDGGA